MVSIDEDLGPEQASTGHHGSIRSLARAATGSLGLNVFNTAATLVTAILLARLMGLADFGIYALVTGTLTLLSIPAILGIDRLVVRDIAVFHSRDWTIWRVA